MYGDEQKAVFERCGATETSTHDMLVPVSRLTDKQEAALLSLEMGLARPRRRGDSILVPCFFRPAAARVLSGPR